MDNLLAQYLDKMLDFEEQGYLKEALQISDKMLESFESERGIILLERGKMEFRNQLDKDALLDLIKAYEATGEDSIYQLILEAYLVPNRENLLETYRKNMKLLEEYPHYCNEYEEEEMNYFPIWQDEELLVCVDIKQQMFAATERKRKESEPEHGEIPMLLNEMWMEEILRYEESSGIENPFMDMNVPIYLAYDKVFWYLFLQIHNLEELISRGRCVFLVGEHSLKSYFSDSMTLMPQILFYNGACARFEEALHEVKQIREEAYHQALANVEEYYKGNEELINTHIKSGKPRILFLTSRFTTALQYHVKDCMKAAKNAGCEVELLIEPYGIYRVLQQKRIEITAKFKPDIVFQIDHFRYEQSFIPEEAVCISWVQDPLPNVMDTKTASGLNSRDFVMNHFTTWKEFRNVGYTEKKLIDAPIPANHHIYKPYDLTKTEYEKYASDICFVCHASDVDAHVIEELQRYPKEWWEIIAAIYKGYQSYVYETGEIFYRAADFREYIKGSLSQHYGLELDENTLEYMSHDMYHAFNQRVFRQALVDWILDAGFTNIKLWGNGWLDDEKYKDYAMGPAENGETLSKIYQSSKIVIGNNIQTTAAARAWETMLSGGFYLSNYIPQEEDITDIRRIIEKQDFVMFHDKKELIEKIHYYLEHEEERQQMIQCGRKAALEKMTYDGLMKRVLDTVAERLEER